MRWLFDQGDTLMSSTQQFQSAEAAAVDRAEEGISEHAMTGGWRVLIARKAGRYERWYFHANDDTRLKEALRRQAWRWLGAN